MIKEYIKKKKYSLENFPKKLVINNKDITSAEPIAENFNKYFSNIGLKLAKNTEVFLIKRYNFFTKNRQNFKL